MLVRWHEIKGVETNEVLQFVTGHVNVAHNRAVFSRAESESGLKEHLRGSLLQLVHLCRLNNVRQLNDFLFKANSTLKDGGVFICRVETLVQRKSRLLAKHNGLFGKVYYASDFILKRVFPKLDLTRRLYYKLTGGRNRAMSKTEVLGRLFFSGFEIEQIKEINGLLYIVSKKVSAPSENLKPSHGMLLKIKRMGANGKKIQVYKLRTMHPYAEYVQAYIHEQNALSPGGKFKDDFRITKWGRWMRKFWIDEIPMIWNIVKGDLKLVGVRPLSEHYLSLYTHEHRAKRTHSKPGLIPPFYADLPITLTDIMDSESRYIDTYVQNGWRADLDYGVKAFNNILVHKARSK